MPHRLLDMCFLFVHLVCNVCGVGEKEHCSSCFELFQVLPSHLFLAIADSALNVLGPVYPHFMLSHLTVLLCGPATCHFFNSLTPHLPSHPEPSYICNFHCWKTYSTYTCPHTLTHPPHAHQSQTVFFLS